MEHNVPTPRDSQPEKQWLNNEDVLKVVRRIENLGEEPIAVHVEAFEDAHRVLQDYLNEAADG